MAERRLDSGQSMLEMLSMWRQIQGFEALANAVLECLLQDVEQLVGMPEHAGAECLRATLYMRPHDSYQAVVSRQRVVLEEHALLSSATMWRWVHERGEALMLDTTLGVLLPFREHVEAVELDDPREDREQTWGKNSSLVLLLERDATHVLLLPVRGLQGAVCGMVGVEVAHEAAMGTLSIWGGEGVERAREIVAWSAPFLLDRLARSPGLSGEHDLSALKDEWLPVVGESMSGRLRMLQAFARQDETLLLTGETGVGKSRLARWCHERSERRRGAMVVLDLAAIPEEMQVAHLMGWQKGAFTGASRDVPGALEQAQGGTLFIDEVDKLSLETQAALLGLLETWSYQKLGASRPSHADVRFIVGTNADLRACVAKGTFRADLYFRVCVLPVHILPLRERSDELMGWAHYMFARALGHEVSLSSEARLMFERASWPGNLRQLDNVVRRVAALLSMEEGAAMQVGLDDVRMAFELATSSHESESLSWEVPLMTALKRGAQRYVAMTRERVEQGKEAIDVELLEAIRGLAYEEALSQADSVEEAFSWFGKQSLVKNRNHRRMIARERQKVEALQAALEKKG